MNEVATDYVKLVLAVGQHDAGYVDAYYGPDEWQTEAEAHPRSLEMISSNAAAAYESLSQLDTSNLEEIQALRHEYLSKQLSALMARVEMLDGKKMFFDEESKALYDAVAPTHGEAHFKAILEELDALLPGEGPLTERRTRFRESFIIPTDKLDLVFSTAIEECRRRTRRHIELPEDEGFTVSYVTDKSWSAYNWFKGNHQSLIEVNTDLPIHIDRAIDLACHEGYPGHHVYNVLLEEQLYRQRGWVEYCVYPLFSPQSLIAEGTANYGIELTFPGRERVDYEREHLFPLAGIDPTTAELYYKIEKEVDKLQFAGNEAARKYLDGEMTGQQAIDWLVTYALMSEERAKQRLQFIDKYRSYVINYNLGKELVRSYLERDGSENRGALWKEFSVLISSPRLPSGLQ